MQKGNYVLTYFRLLILAIFIFSCSNYPQIYNPYPQPFSPSYSPSTVPSILPTITPSSVKPSASSTSVPTPTAKPVPTPTLSTLSPSSFISTSVTPPLGGKTRENYLKIKNVPFTGKFQFVFMGDNRNSSPFSNNGNEVYERMIEKINKLTTKPLFAVNGGDFTFDGLERHWKKFAEMNAKFTMPLLTIVGNHDIDPLYIGTGKGRSYYEEHYTPPNPQTGLDDYSFDYGNTRFIVLDDADYTITDKQFGWLTNQMRTNLGHKIVMTHIPPAYGVWEHPLNDKEISKRFMNICEANKVELVLLCHIHLFDDSVKRNQTQYIISGGVGAPLVDSTYGNAIYHFLIVTIGDNVKYQMLPL